MENVQNAYRRTAFEDLSERSKNDRAFIAGSEVREVIKAYRNLEAKHESQIDVTLKIKDDLNSQLNCTAQLESNIKFLNERIEDMGRQKEEMRSACMEVILHVWNLDMPRPKLTKEQFRIVIKTLTDGLL